MHESIEELADKTNSSIIKKYTFVLVEEEEFKELIDFLDEERGWEDFPRDFNAIVKTPHWDSALALFEESEGC